MKNKHRNTFLIILMLIVLASIALYSDRDKASNLVIVPDSTEYALAAHRFATTGEYKILIEGRWLPPRYPPWFSVFLLTPAYLLLGPEIGNAIYPITFFSVFGILFAFLLGKKIGGYWGGIFASIILLALPIYRMWSKYIMTDVPATVLMLAACLLYLRLRTKTNANPLIFLLQGFIIAFAASFRPVCASVVLPFIAIAFYSDTYTITMRKLTYLMFPLFLLTTASLIYNYLVFGNMLRNGYHFWSSVPYDYVHLSFSLSYIAVNIILLWKSKIIFFTCMAFVVWAADHWIILPKNNGQSRSPSICWIAEFTLWGTGPIVLFHLIYYYPEPRFYLPTLAFVAVMVGGAIGCWLKHFPRSALLGLSGVLVLSQFCTTLEGFKTGHLLYRRLAANEILRYTPEKAWIISAIEPAYIEYLVAIESQRRIMPISRHVEYADKVITPKKIPFPNPPPRDWQDNRCAGLLNGGAQEAVRLVASEQIDLIARQIALGQQIYINTTNIQQEDQATLKELEKRFLFTQQTKNLFELHNRN